MLVCLWVCADPVRIVKAIGLAGPVMRFLVESGSCFFLSSCVFFHLPALVTCPTQVSIFLMPWCNKFKQFSSISTHILINSTAIASFVMVPVQSDDSVNTYFFAFLSYTNSSCVFPLYMSSGYDQIPIPVTWFIYLSPPKKKIRAQAKVTVILEPFSKLNLYCFNQMSWQRLCSIHTLMTGSTS